MRERYRGSLLGLAVGDALGAPFEGMPPGSFPPVEGMTGSGEWTDDTSMALCLAESLVECGGFDPLDQLRRYLRWLREGHLTSTGYAFGIGQTTATALARFEATGEPSGLTDPMSAGNGSLMRLAPVPLFYAADPARAVELSGQSSLTTHATPVCVDACRRFGALVAGAARGLSREELLAAEPPPADRPGTSGYVLDTLEAVLWVFGRTTSFREGCLLAVNLGGDTDTTAAVYGQLVGALYGEEAIPEEWLARLARRELVEGLAERLYESATRRR